MNKYLEKLLDENKLPVVLDYDGVLFEARWYKERINMPNETHKKLLEAYERGENLKSDPIPSVQEIVRKYKDNTYYVLSHMHGYVEYDFKKKQIEKYYPEIPVNRVIMATSVDNKIEHLDIIQKTHGAFIYIDDTHSSLIKFENTFDETCKFFHVSSLYV